MLALVCMRWAEAEAKKQHNAHFAWARINVRIVCRIWSLPQPRPLCLPKGRLCLVAAQGDAVLAQQCQCCLACWLSWCASHETLATRRLVLLSASRISLCMAP